MGGTSKYSQRRASVVYCSQTSQNGVNDGWLRRAHAGLEQDLYDAEADGQRCLMSIKSRLGAGRLCWTRSGSYSRWSVDIYRGDRFVGSKLKGSVSITILQAVT